MKKLLLFNLALMFGLLTYTRAQDMITNHSFEEWNVDPVGWMNPLSTLGIQNVVQSSDAQEGSLSVKFIILWNENAGTWLPATLNSLPMPVTESHTTMHGYYKGTSVEGDELFVTVFLYGDGLISGTGSFSTSATVSQWTPFTVPINYVGGVTPTEAYIYINVIGEDDAAHEGTEYMIDNLSWDPTTGIRDLMHLTGVTTAPNPAIDHLDVQFTLEQSDRMAFDLVSPQGMIETVISGRSFNAGPNTVRIETAGLAQGLYILRAQGEQYNFVKKFIVGR